MDVTEMFTRIEDLMRDLARALETMGERNVAWEVRAAQYNLSLLHREDA